MSDNRGGVKAPKCAASGKHIMGLGRARGFERIVNE
nr:MAG TPA: hypothetical protein [Caudoviricetes sp.]